MNQPMRQVYYKVPLKVHDDLIQMLKGSKDFAFKKFIANSSKCHFIRYSFIRNAEKVSIVFDIKAEMLTITAEPDTVDTINFLYTAALKSKVSNQQEAKSANIVRSILEQPKDNKSLVEQLRSDKSIIEHTDNKRLNAQDKSNEVSASKSVDSKKSKAPEPKKQSQSKSDTAATKKKKSIGSAQMLNSYASEERIYENASENHFIDYNYQDMLKFRINGAMKLESVFKNDSIKDQNSQNTLKNQTIAETRTVGTETKKTSEQKSNKTVKQGAARAKDNVNKASNTSVKDSGRDSLSAISSGSITNKTTKEVVEIKTVEQASVGIKELPEYKDGYSVKKVSGERVKDIISQLKNTDLLRVVDLGTVEGTAGDIVTYSIENKNRIKVYLRHIVKKNMLQLQGKRSELFGEIQILISRDDTFKSSETGGNEQASSYKEVKKALPSAFEFLSEQSKIDFTIGLIDIYSEEVRLSDYSVLLVPPYRGLERLLYDLQKTKGIEVKMIGQAYEKDEGAYTLKAGYRKKINSIVYNEVLSTLYTEYFEKRNFYAHSNNTDESAVRVISDRQQAKLIFEKLIALINYNCKKLKEIGFTMS